MRDLHWYILCSFLQYEVHYSHFKSAFLIGKIVYPHFPMALSWWEKVLWKICTHNWTVHAKVEFQKFLMLGGIPQLLILNWEMKDLPLISFMSFSAILSALQPFQRALNWWKKVYGNCHVSLDSTWKVEFQNILMLGRGVHSTTFDPKLRNERFTLISFMQCLAILSALQPFQRALNWWKKVYGKLSCIIRQYMQK